MITNYDCSTNQSLGLTRSGRAGSAGRWIC